MSIVYHHFTPVHGWHLWPHSPSYHRIHHHIPKDWLGTNSSLMPLVVIITMKLMAHKRKMHGRSQGLPTPTILPNTCLGTIDHWSFSCGIIWWINLYPLSYFWEDIYLVGALCYIFVPVRTLQPRWVDDDEAILAMLMTARWWSLTRSTMRPCTHARSSIVQLCDIGPLLSGMGQHVCTSYIDVESHDGVPEARRQTLVPRRHEG
jgi:hypothetical protein